MFEIALLRAFDSAIASAGADGSAYRTWLEVEHVAPVPFRRTDPRRSRPKAEAGPAKAGAPSR